MPSFEALLVPPPDAAYPDPPKLTDDQRLNLVALEKHFDAPGFTLPVREGETEAAKLSERECMFLSKETFLRFLAAKKQDLHAAQARLEECIVWRRTHQLDDVEAMAKECEEESKTGKNLVLGFTPTGRPIMYFFPNRNTTPVELRRTIHAVFTLERATDLMCNGVTNVLVIFDFAGKRQGPPSSVSNARELLHYLSAYYPERLGMCAFMSMPWVVRAFVSLMWPFVDPVTKSKTNFGGAGAVVSNGDVAADMLLTDCGGTLDAPYNHGTYWPALLSTCLARRQEHLARWRALDGPRVGREERLFKVHPATALIPDMSDARPASAAPATATMPDQQRSAGNGPEAAAPDATAAAS